MADKHAITELLNHAGVAYDTGDSQFLIDMFTDDDAEFSMVIAGGDPIRFEGKDTVAGLFTDSMQEQDDQRRHVVTNIYFTDETDESATAISYLTLITVKDGVLTVLSSGMYTDKVVKVGDEWKIRHRHLDLDLPY